MKLWRRLRLALRIASRIVSTAALRTASIAASSRVELGGKASQGAGPRSGLGLGLEGLLWRLVKECWE